MPIQVCQIFLDKQNEPYESGETVSGKFVLIIKQGYDHKGIFVKFEGHAMIKWLKESSCFEDSYVKENRSRCQYFESIFQYASDDHLPEGTHIFPFEFTLPEHLPSSFASQNTSLWYKIEVLMNKDPKPRREVLIFSVRSKLDLNTFVHEDENSLTDIRNPVSKFAAKNIICCIPTCCNNFHYVSIGLKLPKQGFIHGEKILATLSVCNETMPLCEVTLSIMQEITVCTKEKTMVERKTVGKVAIPDLCPQEDNYRRWEQKISVPKDALTSAISKDHEPVKIQSFLKFSVEASWFPYSVISVSTPIIIGTVPLSPSLGEVPAIEEEILISSGEIVVKDEVSSQQVPKIVVEDTEGKVHQQHSKPSHLQKAECTSADHQNSNSVEDQLSCSPDVYYHHHDSVMRSGRLLVPGRSIDEKSDLMDETETSKPKLRKSRSTSIKSKISDSKFSSPEFKRAFGVDFSKEGFTKISSARTKVDLDKASHESRTTALQKWYCVLCCGGTGAWKE